MLRKFEAPARDFLTNPRDGVFFALRDHECSKLPWHSRTTRSFRLTILGHSRGNCINTLLITPPSIAMFWPEM